MGISSERYRYQIQSLQEMSHEKKQLKFKKDKQIVGVTNKPNK